jgi:transcriptional regulator with XRE-family HTH domain
MVSGAQIRDARILLGWTRRDLARRAEVSIFTVKQIEEALGINVYPGAATLEATLRGKGIVFLDGTTPTLLRRNRTK